VKNLIDLGGIRQGAANHLHISLFPYPAKSRMKVDVIDPSQSKQNLIIQVSHMFDINSCVSPYRKFLFFIGVILGS
jgi:hypothetical protein